MIVQNLKKGEEVLEVVVVVAEGHLDALIVESRDI